GGSCAAAILRDLATAGSTIYGFDEDCYLTKPRETSWRVYQRWYQHLLPEPEERRLRSTRGAQNLTAYRAKSAEIAAKLRNLTAPSAGGRAVLPNVLFDAESKGLPRDLVSKEQKVRAVDAKHNYNTERNFALANCVFDSVAATTWMMRALLSIEEASRNCPEPKACTVDVLYVLGSFSYAAQTLSLAFVDCPKRGKREALCGADISDVVGSMAIFVASTLQAAEYCDATFRAPTGPIRGGLRSAAGHWRVTPGLALISVPSCDPGLGQNYLTPTNKRSSEIPKPFGQPHPSPRTVAAPAMAVEDQQLIADAQNEERSAGGWRRASGPLVLGLLGSNLLLLCMVLWLAITAGAGSPSADGPTDHDLMLPLHSEFRREQQEQRHLFDVNLFDEPDEPYEDYPTDTGTWYSW
ncbi:unnamed protein product, partial [Cladocopium goreaui]